MIRMEPTINQEENMGNCDIKTISLKETKDFPNTRDLKKI